MLLIFSSGAILGAGLLLSGILRPSKVLGALTVGKHWDPTVAIAYGVSILLNLLSYRIAYFKNTHPVYSNHFEPLTGRRTYKNVYIGSAIFGVGLGLSGIDIGPSLVYLFISNFGLYFVLSSMVG